MHNASVLTALADIARWRHGLAPQTIIPWESHDNVANTIAVIADAFTWLIPELPKSGRRDGHVISLLFATERIVFSDWKIAEFFAYLI